MESKVTGEDGGLMQYLPAIYAEDAVLGQFLSAFEKVLLGSDDGVSLAYKGGKFVGDSGAGEADATYRGLEETIAGLADFFDPKPYVVDEDRAPKEFLEWLSGWVALSLRADLGEEVQRDFISKAVWLYSMRGTKRGLEETIKVYTILGAEIQELITPFQLGVHSTVGVDTMLDAGAAHFFRVTVNFKTTGESGVFDPKKIERMTQVVAAIIELEKPAHTYYSLTTLTPTMQIAVHSTVGVDTLLGSEA
jgi:phage tail-like protein